MLPGIKCFYVHVELKETFFTLIDENLLQNTKTLFIKGECQ